MKIVINKCFGGFSLSKEAYEFLGLKWDGYGFDYSHPTKRADPELIRCVETLGKKASGDYSELEVIEIPDDVNWCIDDYDGNEWVAEVHRTWS